jgi:hypothetical protein
MRRIALILTTTLATRVEFMEFKPAQKPCCHPYEAAHPAP